MENLDITIEDKIDKIGKDIDTLKNDNNLDNIIKKRELIENEIKNTINDIENLKNKITINNNELITITLDEDFNYDKYFKKIENLNNTILNNNIIEQIKNYNKMEIYINQCLEYLNSKKGTIEYID
jgi:hypothetical protein